MPFSKAVKTNPDVIRVAKMIGRTPSAVAFKLGNFGSFDPELKKRGIGGLPNVSRLDKEIWDEFNSNWEELAYESERLIAEFDKRPIEDAANIDVTDLPVGRERESVVKARVNQSFFRQAILSSYGGKCCITGMNIPSLLVASHIVPWSKDKDNRTNPRNGLCLNALHDRAFDNGLLTITKDYRVKFSRRLGDLGDSNFIKESFYSFEDKEITLPNKFQPDKGFLLFHNKEVFQG